MLSAQFPDFIIGMSESEEFTDCMEYLTQERFISGFGQDLVLRFFALKNRREKFKHEVSDFLTEYMEDVADSAKPETFDYVAEEEIFRKTFKLLRSALGAYSFAFAKKDRSGLSGGFSTYHFEGVTIGLQSVIHKINPDDDAAVGKLRVALEKIKLDPAFIKITTGGGKNSPGLLAQRIKFVADALQNDFA
jgi:hypothetical protein